MTSEYGDGLVGWLLGWFIHPFDIDADTNTDTDKDTTPKKKQRLLPTGLGLEDGSEIPLQKRDL